MTSYDVGRFLLNNADQAGEVLLSLKEYTYQDVIDNLLLSNNFKCVDANESFELVSQLLKGPNIKYLLAVSADESIVGIVEKSHRRY